MFCKTFKSIDSVENKSAKNFDIFLIWDAESPKTDLVQGSGILTPNY